MYLVGIDTGGWKSEQVYRILTKQRAVTSLMLGFDDLDSEDTHNAHEDGTKKCDHPGGLCVWKHSPKQYCR
jgi:hypothetical protein